MSVVVPARDAADTLGAQLAALANQEFASPWQLIIVDNVSRDCTAEIASSWETRMPHLQLLACPHRGANRARNLGVRASYGDRVLLCDADDVVSPTWIREMSAALDRYDVICGRLEYTSLNGSGAYATRQGPAADRLPRPPDGRLAFGSLGYAIGANMGFRRSVFDAVGGFDESFIRGSNEVDFSWLAQYAGFTLGFAPEAVVYYRYRARSAETVRQSYRLARGHAHLYAKHHGLGRLPAQSPRDKLTLLYGQLKRLGHVERLVKPGHRWWYFARLGYAAGTIGGLLEYHVAV